MTTAFRKPVASARTILLRGPLIDLLTQGALSQGRDMQMWPRCLPVWRVHQREREMQNARGRALLEAVDADRVRVAILRPEQQAPRFMLSTLVATSVARARLRVGTP